MQKMATELTTVTTELNCPTWCFCTSTSVVRIILWCASGTILVASAFHIAQLVIGRVILGVGVGFATQATPLYLTEMAPYNLRGALNIMFQLAVTIGIFAAQLINYGVQVREAA